MLKSFEAITEHRGGQLTCLAKALQTALKSQQRRVSFAEKEESLSDDEVYSDDGSDANSLGSGSTDGQVDALAAEILRLQTELATVTATNAKFLALLEASNQNVDEDSAMHFVSVDEESRGCHGIASVAVGSLDSGVTTRGDDLHDDSPMQHMGSDAQLACVEGSVNVNHEAVQEVLAQGEFEQTRPNVGIAHGLDVMAGPSSSTVVTGDVSEPQRSTGVS